MSRWAAFVLIVSLLGLAFPLRADDSAQNAGSTPAGGSGPSQHYGGANTENTQTSGSDQEAKDAEQKDQKLLGLMTDKLSLTPDQQATVKTSLQTQSTKMLSAKKEFVEKAKSIRSDADNQIMASLNDDQKKKYLESKAEMEKEASSRGPVDGMHFGQGGGGHGGGRHGGGSFGGGGT